MIRKFRRGKRTKSSSLWKIRGLSSSASSVAESETSSVAPEAGKEGKRYDAVSGDTSATTPPSPATKESSSSTSKQQPEQQQQMQEESQRSRGSIGSLLGFFVDTSEAIPDVEICPFMNDSTVKTGNNSAESVEQSDRRGRRHRRTPLSESVKNRLDDSSDNKHNKTTTSLLADSSGNSSTCPMKRSQTEGMVSVRRRGSLGNSNTSGDQRPSLIRRASMIRLDGIDGFPPMESMNDDDDPMSPKRGSCPFFVGAADKNAALLMTQGTTSSHVHFRSSSALKAELGGDLPDDIGGNGLRVEVDYSYTSMNLEFPNEIKEEELFGHPTCEGYMSREHGLMIPDYEKALSDLKASRGHIWYTMGRRMEGLKGNNGLLKAVEEMEIIEGSEANCPDGSLQIASAVLSHLANGYRAACWRNNVMYEPCPAIQIPWQTICERLGRKDVYVAPEDFMYQQRPIRANVFEFDNMEMITPIWGTSAETLMSKLFCESNRHLRNMTESILALARGDWQAKHIKLMIGEVKELTRMLGKSIPDGSAGERSIDPVEFATAFANATSPLKEGVPALSGGGCPIFVIMDHIIGRQKWDSAMGADLLMQIEWMPKNWRRFIEFLRQKRLFEHVPDHLQYLWMLLKDVYCGERGWLGKHKYRAYQFVELAGALGRTSNKGNDSGEGTVRMLEESRRERDPTISDDRSSYKTCPFRGTIKSVKRVSEDRISKLVTISCAKELMLQIGDHVGIVMRNSDDKIWEFASRHNLDINAKLSLVDGTLNEEWRERLDYDSLEHKVYNVLMCAKLSKYKGQHATSEGTLKLLCESLHPEEPRLYSFATIHPLERQQVGGVTTFDILVTRTNAGGCSAFLHESIGSEISFGLSTAIKCYIPTITTRPLVVIAAGSGLGTYLPMLVNDTLRNPKYAFLAYRTENTVPYLDSHLKKAVNYGKLKLFVELSREEKTITTVDRYIKRRPTARRYIDRLLMDERELIRELAGPIDEGGMEASFFVCGNNEFFRTVRLGLEAIDPGMVESLVRSSRLQLEVQARGGIDGKQDARPVKLTETCFHNSLDDYWCIINDTVYDFTEYLPWHPGGRKILHYIAGTDATEFWKRVSHDKDRMVYSQIAAYEVGPFDASDPDGLMEYLEFVTRAGNCVNLYKEKKDLFQNLCDSYGKVQNVWESIVSREFMELMLKLVDDEETRRKMFSRIYFVKHGTSREISNKMFGVAPIIKGHKHGKPFKVPGVRIALRPVRDDERSALEARLIGTSNHYFTRFKRAIVEAAEAIPNSSPTDHQRVYSKMFYRLIMAFEELYSSLSQPMPLPSIRCWDVIREEVVARQTFNWRFAHIDQIVPEEYENLAMQDLPETEEERDFWFDEITNFLQLETHQEFRAETGLSTDVIEGWFEKKDIRRLFERLDVDKDGLVKRKSLLEATAKDDLEDYLLSSLVEELESDDNKETFDFKDFLLASPELSEKNKIARVSSLLFSGLRRTSSGNVQFDAGLK